MGPPSKLEKPPPPGGGTPAGEALSFGEAERRKLTRRAGVVGAGTLLSRVFGLVRDQVLTALFSRAATDAFIVAFRIPNILRRLLGEGLVQNGALPVLNETREKQGEAAAQEFFRALRGLSWILLLGVTVLGVVFAPQIVWVFVPGYDDRPEQYAVTVELTRWLFPYIFFMGTASMGVAALNAHRRFVVTSFAPTLLNLSIIVSAIALPTWFRSRGVDPVLALVPGVLVGGLLQVLAQWPSLTRIGYFSAPRLMLSHPGVRETVRRMIPALFGVGIYWIDITLSTVFLSELPTGSQSYFNWAMRLCDVPQGVFALALSTAALPTLSSLYARGETAELGKTLAYGLKLSLFVAIPATVLFTTAATPLIVALFQRGQFGPLETAQTAHSLIAQGLGIWAVAGVRQLVAVYYAVGDTRTPAYIAALNLAVFVSTCLALRGPLGHVGIAAAVTTASVVQFLALWVHVNWKHVSLPGANVGASALKTLAASAAAAGTSLAVSALLTPWLSGGLLLRIVPGVLVTLTFGVTFLIAAWLVRSQELSILQNAVTLRFRKGQRR